jgi:hypothetical protein
LFLSPITYLPPTTSCKTLGCYKSPSGYYKKSLEAITAKVTEKTALIANSSFDSKCTLQSYYSVLLPSITYPLSITNIPEKAFIKLQRLINKTFLPQIGSAQTTPKEVLYGPSSLGGANFWTII